MAPSGRVGGRVGGWSRWAGLLRGFYTGRILLPDRGGLSSASASASSASSVVDDVDVDGGAGRDSNDRSDWRRRFFLLIFLFNKRFGFLDFSWNVVAILGKT